MKEWIECLKIDKSQVPIDVAKLAWKNGFQAGNLGGEIEYCYLAAHTNYQGGKKTIAFSSSLSIVDKRLFIAFALAYYFQNIEKIEIHMRGKFFKKFKVAKVYNELDKNKEMLDFVLDVLLPWEKIEEELKTKNGLLLNTIIMILASKYSVPEFLVQHRLNQMFELQNVSQKETNPDEEAKRISFELPKIN